MRSNHHILIFTCLALIQALPSLAHGQSDNTPHVSMKVDLVSWGNDIVGLYLNSGSKSNEVTAKAFRYTQAVAYNGSQIVEISKNPAVKDPSDEIQRDLPKGVEPVKDEGSPINPADVPPEIQARRKDNPNLVALATLPLNSTRATILLAPAKGGTFQTYVIDDDPSKLPLGNLRIHNYCPFPVAIKCNGSKPIAMKTKDALIVPPKDKQVVYELAYEKEGKWVQQENNLVPLRPIEQAQLIILRSNADFFRSSSGGRSGYLQTVVLRRGPEAPAKP